MADLSVNKLIGAIIIALVIGIMIIFIVPNFRGKVLDYIRNLPDYKYNSEDLKVVEGDAGKAEGTLFCDVSAGDEIIGSLEGNVVILEEKKTNLIIEDKKIKIDRSWIKGDIEIGSVDDHGKIIIDAKYFKFENFSKYSGYLPKFSEFLKLYNSFINTGSNPLQICKKKEQLNNVPETGASGGAR